MEELEVPVDGLLSEGVAADDGESGLAATEQVSILMLYVGALQRR